MNSRKAQVPTYHLIDLEGQDVFAGAGGVHQTLRMNKTLLLNAIASQSAPQFGPAYETPAGELPGAYAPLEALQQILTTLEVENVVTTYTPSELAAQPEADSTFFTSQQPIDVALATTLDATLLVAEGDSVPGPVLEIGNTNSRYRFPIGAKRFMNEWSKQGPAHHCAIGVGHIANKIEKLGKIIGVDVVKVC